MCYKLQREFDNYLIVIWKKIHCTSSEVEVCITKDKTPFKKAEGRNSFVGLRKEFLFQNFSSENKWVKIKSVFRTYSNI